MDTRTAQTSIENGSWIVRLDGQITEEFVFPTPPAGVHSAVVDLSRISYINSTGVRSWMVWCQSLSNHKAPSGEPIRFAVERAPLSFLRLMELIKDMIPSTGALNSFYVSFSCLDCGKIQHVEVANPPLNENTRLIEGHHLPRCGECDYDTELEMAPSFYASLTRLAPKKSS